MKSIRDITAADLDAIFRDATLKAARETMRRGLPVTGLDAEGRLVVIRPSETKE